MKVVTRISTIVAALFAALFILGSCANPVLGTPADFAGAKTLAVPVAVEPLVAGQHIDAGTVSISRDEDTLFVTYATNGNFLIDQTHVWVGTDVNAVPHSPGGLINGQFGFGSSYAPPVSSATVEVPITWADGTNLVIFAHASLIGNAAGFGNETAYGGTATYNGVTRWNFYIGYTLPPFTPEVPDRTISGVVYFDANGNGVRDIDEPGIPGIVVSLSKDGNPVASMPSAADGSYLFTGLLPAEYLVASGSSPGLTYTTASSATLTATATMDFGLDLDTVWIGSQTANGFTIGYWKTNIDKAIANVTKGIQVGKTTLLGYVSTLSGFALSPLNPATLQAASAILSATGSDPSLLLAKQLMGSEFNYANGAFIGGNQLVTYLFLYDGEYILKHAADFSAAQILAAKNLFDAYNNSHGGLIIPVV